MSTSRQCQEAFRRAIFYVQREFKTNPMRFFSEKDFHWLLSRRLEQELVDQGVQDDVDQLWPTAMEGLQTSLVHQEYGTNMPGPERYDVCLLPPEEVAKIDEYKLKIEGQYVRPAAVAEYTTEPVGTGTFRKEKGGIEDGDLVDKFAWDIKKLTDSDASDTYAELLYRVPVRTEGGAERHMNRYSSRLHSVIERAAIDHSAVTVSVIIYYLHSKEWQDLSRGDNPAAGPNGHA